MHLKSLVGHNITTYLPRITPLEYIHTGAKSGGGGGGGVHDTALLNAVVACKRTLNGFSVSPSLDLMCYRQQFHKYKTMFTQTIRDSENDLNETETHVYISNVRIKFSVNT